jgi:pyruvate/2-oxoacid:ferredoxin oxidoreductase alpha subunit
MNLSQTKLVGQTMELDLKTREYKKLCDKLEQLKQSDINPNDEKLLELKQLFQKNYDEIVEINRKINELKETEELIEKQKLEQYDPANIFKRKNNNIFTSNEEENMNISIVETKKNVFARLIEKIKEIFSRNNK